MFSHDRFDSNKKKQKVYQQSLISEIGEYERRQIDDQLRKVSEHMFNVTVGGSGKYDVHGLTLMFWVQSLAEIILRSCKP